MSAGNHHQIWIEQCEAGRTIREPQTIRERFGLQAAFDYAVGEKLMNFASAAFEHPAFARELPRFVSEVRRMFSADEIRSLNRSGFAGAVHIAHSPVLWKHFAISYVKGKSLDVWRLADPEKPYRGKKLYTSAHVKIYIYACMDWRHMAEMLAAGDSANFELLNLCVWVKTNGGHGLALPLKA